MNELLEFLERQPDWKVGLFINPHVRGLAMQVSAIDPTGKRHGMQVMLSQQHMASADMKRELDTIERQILKSMRLHNEPVASDQQTQRL